MTNFKRGDKVRRTGEDFNNVRKGSIYTVSDAYDFVSVTFDEIQGTYSPDQFELIEPDPFRAFTAPEGWEEYTSNGPRNAPILVLYSGDGRGTRYFKAVEPAAPLPTKPWTVISVEWIAQYYRTYTALTLAEDGKWTALNSTVAGVDLPKFITSWKLLAEPIGDDR